MPVYFNLIPSLFSSFFRDESQNPSPEQIQNPLIEESGSDPNLSDTYQMRSHLVRRRVVRDINLSTDINLEFLTPLQLREKLGIVNIKNSDYIRLKTMEEILKLYPNLNRQDKVFAGILLLNHLDCFKDRIQAANFMGVRSIILLELDKFKDAVQSNLHLIWVGSLPETVKTNIRLFLESTPPNAGKSLTFNLSYDPRGYMAHRLKASIYRIAQSSVNNLPIGPARDRRYQMAIIMLQNQAYASIKGSGTPEEFSQGAIDFISLHLGGDRKQLEQELQKAKESFIRFEKEMDKEYQGRVRLIDLSTLIRRNHPLYEYYLREMWLRGNLPSAADMARSELLSEYGGTYIDVDVSPLLQEGIFGPVIDQLGEEILEIVASSSESSFSKWRAWLQAAKVQAVHNFIAKRPHNRLSGIFAEEIFERMRNDVICKKNPEISRYIEEYIHQIQAAPAQYMSRLNVDANTSEVRYLFQPLKQPKIFQNGLSMQVRPGGLFGYDIGVLHGREGGAAFNYYQKLVAERYRALEQGDVFWEKSIPGNMDNNPALRDKYNGYYRLDGLVEGLNATEYITGPKVFSRAAIESFGAIQNGDLEEKWNAEFSSFDTELQSNAQDRKLFPLFVEATVLEFDTPEDVKSAWRGEVLPRRFRFSQESKYTTQIVLQLDQNAQSIEAARHLDNRHKNSRWMIVDNHGDLRQHDDGESSKIIPEKWDDNTRIVLVGTLLDHQATISGRSAADVAKIIRKLVPNGMGKYPISRIKLVGWSLDAKTHQGISSRVGAVSMKGFSFKLLKMLKENGMPVESLKAYAGPVEVDVRGRTWVANSRGIMIRNSAILRLLVEVKDGQPVMREAPIKNIFDDADILPNTPVLSVGKSDRRAIILMVSKEQLKSNKMSEFREAVINFRIKHPGAEVYALSREDNGRFKQWKFDPSIRPGEWAENWHLSGGLAHKDYNKIILLGHGSKEDKQINGIENDEIAAGFTKLVKNVSKIEHITILACGTHPEFGVMLYNKLMEDSSTSIHNKVVIDRISGSELPVYIAGNSGTDITGIQPGSRLYRDKKDGNIKHGVNDAKWEVKRGPAGNVEVTTYLLPSMGNGMVVPEIQGHAGPFSYAHQQQRLNQGEKVIESWARGIKKMREHVIKNVDHAFYENESDIVAMPSIKKKDGKFWVSVTNIKSQSDTKVEIPQELAEEMLGKQNELIPAYDFLNSRFKKSNDGYLVSKEIGEAEGHPGTLNGAFFTMALLRYLKDKGSDLSSTEKLSVYWNLGGMGVAVAGDGAELGKTVSQIMAPGAEVEQSLQTLGRIFEKANIVFMVGSIGFDSYELASTRDPVKRISLGVGLGFNVAALGLQGGSMAVSYFLPAAAGTLGAFGSLAVPLAGLGFGFSALSGQIAQHNEEVHEFYKFFIEYFKACDEGVYSKQNDVLIPAENVPVAEINYRTGKITLSDVRLVESREQKNWIQRAFGAVPEHVYTPGYGYTYFDVLKPKEKIINLDTHTSAIVLSAIPPMNIDDIYVDSTTKTTSKMGKVNERLQAVGEFAPSNSWGNLKPKIKPDYRSGTQRVILDEKQRIIFFPSKGGASQMGGKIDFVIEGGGGSYTLRNLSAGVKLALKDLGSASYFLEVPDEALLGENDGSIITNGNTKTLTIGTNLKIDITDLHPDSKITLIGNGQTTRNIDLSKKKSLISALNLRLISMTEVDLNQLADQGQLTDFVSLTQGPVLSPLPKENANAEENIRYQNQLKEEFSTHVLWDTKNRQIIAPGKNYPLLETRSLKDNEVWSPWLGIKVGGLTEKYAFFFHAQKQMLIQTDRSTNQEVANFSLRFGGVSRIEGVTQIGNQVFVQQKVRQQQTEVTLLHALKEDKIELVQVEGLDSERLERFMSFSNTLLTDIKTLKREGAESASGINFMEVFASHVQLDGTGETISLRRAEISEWVRIQGTNSKGNLQTVFLNLKNGYSLPMDAGNEDCILIKSWMFPPETGGMGLMLWSPKKKTAQFVKLSPNFFTPAIIRSEKGNEQRTFQGFNPPASFHSIAENQKVVPFEEYEQIYWVKEEGTEVITVDSYGKQTPWQYHVQLLPPQRDPLGHPVFATNSNSPKRVTHEVHGPVSSERMDPQAKYRLLAV